jgi:integrase
MAWIEWRLAQATPEARLRGEIALFWNPTARNTAKRWTPDALERQWNAACESVGVRVPFQEGTRYTTLTALAQELPERVLRHFSRHRNASSLDHYAKPKATPEAIVKALRRDK